jgi:hypothetical protein
VNIAIPDALMPAIAAPPTGRAAPYRRSPLPLLLSLVQADFDIDAIEPDKTNYQMISDDEAETENVQGDE